MRKVIIMFWVGLLIAFCTTSILSAEASKTKPPEKSQSIKTETSVQQSEKIHKIDGTVVGVDTEKNILTIKKPDGSEVTLKAIKPKTQEEIRNVKIGENISVVCKESKKEGMILRNIVKEKAEKGKKKIGKK